MMQMEFEQMMGISDRGMCLKLHPELYKVIELNYMESDMSKADFCEEMKREYTLLELASDVIGQQASELTELKEEIEVLSAVKDEIRAMGKQIQRYDTELDIKDKQLRERDKQLREKNEEIIRLKAKLYDFMIGVM